MRGLQRQVIMHLAVATIALGVGCAVAGAAGEAGTAGAVATTGVANPPKKVLPTVVALADDTDTRGDWIGTYGSYAYVLCGMRAPESLYSGAAIGDAVETPKARLSSAPAIQDRSVLLEPSGLKRTPACWSQGGETGLPGEKPDLYIKVSVPEGPFLLSLYFFEMDWPQYRSYRVGVYTDEATPTSVLSASIDNFLKGKYKRFVVLGPANLIVVIRRGQSPDAEVSGIFLDALATPDTQLLDSPISERISPEALPAAPLPDVATAAKSAEDALVRLLAAPKEASSQEAYIRQEEAFFRAMRASAQDKPETYYRTFVSLWSAAETRTRKAITALDGSTTVFSVRLLNYYALHGRCSYKNARQAIREMTDELVAEAKKAGEPWPRQAELLQNCAVALLQQGRRNEAEIALRAFSTVCLDLEPADASKEKLIHMGKLALRADVPLPIAEALSEWESRHGPLATEERLLLGNLYYVAGKNDRALAMYEAVEPQMNQGRPHSWLLIAMMTAHLRENRLKEATSIFNRLSATYPHSTEVEEGQYRLAAHYFDVRQFDKARQCFIELRNSSTSTADYQRMADEYLGKIEQVAKLTKP